MLDIALAQAAVGFFLTKVAEGSARAIGDDTYKASLEKLKGFFSYKFAGKSELEQAKADPKKLIELVAKEISSNTDFKKELENLVISLQHQSSEANTGNNTYQNVDSVADFDVSNTSNSNVSGHDTISNNSFAGSSGQNYVGGDQRGSTFH
jgi:hypothetical protein